MKKFLLTFPLLVTFFLCTAVSASALENNVVKVGLRYGSSALFSANLENAEGGGYTFGYYEDDRTFTPLGDTEERAISMTAAGDIYMTESGSYSREMPSGTFRYMGPWHVELDGFSSYEKARRAARDYDGWPAWIDGAFVVRTGCYDSRREAEDAAAELGGYAQRSSDTGVLVTVTKTTEILFEFDDHGGSDLGVEPIGWDDGPVTWFKGYKYRGGFSYPRTAGGDLSVINYVDLEDYVKGVVPHEMSGSWPMEALKAQAVCARTFACRESKHLSAYGFDVCASTDCQVYNGVNGSNAATDQAVEETAGECIWYDGEPIRYAVYHSSNGGATEDAVNVWGTETPYLRGKADPYESLISIPNSTYSVTYTADELTWILQQKGYSVGQVRDVYVSEYTPMGNVYKVTFLHDDGELTVKRETCRTIFYSSTYGKSVRSMRFGINGQGVPEASGGHYINGSGTVLPSLEGVSAITGDGQLTALSGGDYYAVSASGTEKVAASSGNKTTSGRPSSRKRDEFTITGTGNGHNLGMSQYGAKAMAENGYDHKDILTFYYEGVTIK